MGKREELVVGLDIGTTKVCAIVGELTEDGLDVIGIGSAPSQGLRKGVVINIDSTVASIKQAIEEAELMAGCEITTVYAGLSGGHVRGFNSHGVVAVNKDREVRETDVQRVLDAAKAVAIPLDREVLHILPREYVIDDQDGIKEPLGMSGVRLEVKVHIVTGAVTSAQNIVKSCNRCTLNVADIVLGPLAAAEACLHADEKELGVVLVDIGGGTTDICIFGEGAILHTSVISLGGNQITNDVAVGLRTPVKEAERLKQRYGCALMRMVEEGDSLEAPSVGGRGPRVLHRQVLAEIIEPRVEEIFELVKREIDQSGHGDRLASGVVVTGGTSLLEGLPELAEEVLGMPVRRGAPKGVGGLVDVVRSPMYASGVGLVLYGAAHREMQNVKVREQGAIGKVASRVGRWFGRIL
jgi:cell division protein FtsA